MLLFPRHQWFCWQQHRSWCTGSARGEGCGVNGGAGGSKIRYSTTGYGDICCSEVGAKLEVNVTVRVASLVVAPSARRCHAIGGSDGHGGRYVIVRPVKLSSCGIVISAASVNLLAHQWWLRRQWRKGCSIAVELW